MYPYSVVALYLPDVYQHFWIWNQVHRQLTVKEKLCEGHCPPGGVVHGHRCMYLKVSRSPSLDMELMPGKLVVLPHLTEVYPWLDVHQLCEYGVELSSLHLSAFIVDVDVIIFIFYFSSMCFGQFLFRCSPPQCQKSRFLPMPPPPPWSPSTVVSESATTFPNFRPSLCPLDISVALMGSNVTIRPYMSVRVIR